MSRIEDAIAVNHQSKTGDSLSLCHAQEKSAMHAHEPGQFRIAVVIPCFRVRRHILDVVGGIDDSVDLVIVVDDACPERSGQHVLANCPDPRLHVVHHEQNMGVGGAVLTGYQKAIDLGANVIVKVDGDGQMDASLIPRFVAPIRSGTADYVKGNRFYDLTHIGRMPTIRLVGNAILSFMTKLSSGYWDIFDPTNGFTAIDARVAARLPHDRIAKRYFFETDMLFRLGTFRAVVVDVPIDAVYGDEVSNLSVRKVLGEFLFKHVRNFCKRIFYNYFLRDMSSASIELVVGLALLLFGVVFGGYHWWYGSTTGVTTPAGTIMLAAMPILVGLQLLLAFLSYDIAATPRLAISPRLGQPIRCRK
jgi:glycosyltransferase involved in cell wall biosynthesis